MRATLLTAALVLFGGTPTAAAQTSSASPGGSTVALTDLDCSETAELSARVAWPAEAPVWEFEIVRPSATLSGSTVAGTGVRLLNVTYQGRKVFERADVPVLNVEYDVGAGCGCFRDENADEVPFEADGVRLGAESCFAESTPGVTRSTCETDTGGDIGDFAGMAFEDYGDELVLTTHTAADWYRYRTRWHFYADGRIWPEFSFAAAAATCTNAAHRHHAYWRFDFDLDDTPTNDVVREFGPGGETVFTTEADRTWGAPADGVYWTVTDAESEIGYRITPSAEDLLLPVDDFSQTDALVLKYAIDEFADTPFQCEIDYSEMQDGESVDGEDIVFWYRSSALHSAGNPWECDIVGPTLTPIGTFVSGEPGAQAPTATRAVEVQAAVPNPSADGTSVRFRVASDQAVTVALYDALGRRVRVLFEGALRASRYESVRVERGDLPDGTYLVRVETDGGVASTRIAFVGR